MSKQQLAEREAARAGAARHAREAGRRRSATVDRSEDHLIRGYD
ncbi:hypothetical protein [Actinophytocola sp.]